MCSTRGGLMAFAFDGLLSDLRTLSATIDALSLWRNLSDDGFLQ
jgi:hypothetical protein